MKDRWVALMYHGVTTGGAGGAGPDYFAVPARAFAEQLDALRDWGFAGCSLDRAIRASGTARVGITFDDGDASQYARAFPELVRHQMTATFFVVTDWVGRAGYATWDQLREMKAEGMSIQSHTRSHPFLSELSGDAVADELASAKARLDEELGQDTEMLALPGGDRPRRPHTALIAATGYRVVATSRWGVMTRSEPGHEPHFICRCTVRGRPTLARFRQIVAGGWSLAAQRRARDDVLGSIRRILGPSRYARWRRALLAAIATSSEPAGMTEGESGDGDNRARAAT
jgi:peptidoglycan/xylan/chitin deacetylase (PgdA/CDA1 family)